MKIVACSPNGGAFKYILSGVGNAFRKSGTSFTNVERVPTDFDLYLGCSGWRQIIPPKSTRKGVVGIHVNPYGRKKVGSVDGGPVIDEPQEAIRWTLAQQPDFVFCYCSEPFIDEYFGFWTKRHGIPVVPMPTAADLSMYRPKDLQKEFSCDIGWVGGYWPYKAKMLDKYLKPLFNKYKCNIYGWHNSWGNRKIITDANVPILFSSAKICPSVSESHTVLHPVDVPERVFKVPASGGFTIHTPSPAIQALFGDAIPMAQNPTHWFKLIHKFMNDNAGRKELALKQKAIVLSKHTYFDRCVGIATQINDLALKEALLKTKATFCKYC